MDSKPENTESKAHQFDADKYIRTIQNIKKFYKEYVDLILICYTTGQSENKDFIKLRDNVVIDSLVYHKFVVPSITQTLELIRENFGLFDQKGYNDVTEFFSDLQQFKIDVDEIETKLQNIVQIHTEVAAMAKTRQIHATDIARALGNLNETRKKQLENLEKKIKDGDTNQIADIIHQGLNKMPLNQVLIQVFDFISCALFGDSKQKNIEQRDLTEQQIAVDDVCIKTIEINLEPALTEYALIMKSLLEVFTAMKVDADDIKQEAATMEGKTPVRCRILFDHLKENADNLRNVSKELVVFYQVAESDFVAMNNCKAKLSFIGKWKEYLKIEKISLLQSIIKFLKDPKLDDNIGDDF